MYRMIWSRYWKRESPSIPIMAITAVGRIVTVMTTMRMVPGMGISISSG